MHSKNRGFTIIELLVAIAIIGILSASILVYLDTTRARARDARRLSDMNELSKALALYHGDHQQYPVASTEIIIDSGDSMSLALESDGVISDTPADPLHPGLVYRYQTNLTGSTFSITFCMETTNFQGYTQDCNNVKRP